MGSADSEFSTRLGPKLIEALTHPLKGTVLTAVGERPGATIAEISRRLARSPRSVRHHLEWLVDSGLVVIEGESPKRGTRQRHYAPATRLLVFHSDQPIDSQDERRDLSLGIAKIVVEDLRRSIAEGAFATRQGEATIRTPGVVDDVGWRELVAIMDETMDRIIRVMETSAERLEAEGTEGVEVLTALLFFQAAPWTAADGQADAFSTAWRRQSEDTS